MVRYSFVTLALCVSFYARTGSAQSASTIAEALFEQGRSAMRSQDYETACARFRESNRLDPAAGTLFNLASCEEQRSKLATAWELYRATLEQLPAGDPRVEIARSHLSALEPRLPHVTIRLAAGAPATTVVTRGTLELQGASLGVPLPVDPGKQELRVRAPGYAEHSYAIDLSEGQSAELEVAPGDAASPGAPGGEASASTTSAPSRLDATPKSSQRSAGYIVGGIGLAAVGVGAVTGFMTLHDKSVSDAHCSAALRLCDSKGANAADQGRTLGMVSGATLIAGALGLAVGSYLILSSPRPEEHARRTRLQFAWLPGAAQVGAEGTW